MTQTKGSPPTMHVFDTGGNDTGAAAAAAKAMKAGAPMIFGPLFASQVRAVLATVAGRIPVVTFSNDSSLYESGAFLMGITPDQGISAVLGYARRRGIRRLALVTQVEGWPAAISAKAAAVAQSIGMDVQTAPDLAALVALPSPDKPDAVLLPTGSDLERAAMALQGTDIQLLGAFQGLNYADNAVNKLDGAWVSAPDPAAFAAFADTFESRNGIAPGAIAGLAYDAATMAVQLRLSGGMDRASLLSSAGFKGVCGDIRFRDNGSAVRDMAILAIQGGSYRVVERSGLT